MRETILPSWQSVFESMLDNDELQVGSCEPEKGSCSGSVIYTQLEDKIESQRPTLLPSLK